MSWRVPLLLWLALVGGAALAVRVRYGMALSPSRIAPAERAEVIARLRARCGGAPFPDGSRVATDWTGYATLWCHGERRARVAITSRAGRGVGGEALPDGEGCRVKVDVERGRGAIASIDPLLSLSLVPGIDGLGVRFRDGREELLLPDELLHADLLAGHRPLPSVDFDIGLDSRAAIQLLAVRAGLSGSAWRAASPSLFRVRTEGFIETSDGPREAIRGHLVEPALTVRALDDAARAGGDYLLAHLHAADAGSDGPAGARFDYEYFTLRDQSTTSDDYSLPRHAGAAWFLASLAGATQEPRFADGARRALGLLEAAHPPGCDGERACIGFADARSVEIGTAALALTAAVEYQRATGDARFAPWARRLGRFLRWMQLEDGPRRGEFRHFVRVGDDAPGDGRDGRTTTLYFSGEATLGLAALAQIEPDPDLAAALDRAFAWLTDGVYRTLAGQFFYGEDHWTCIALDRAWDLLPPAHRERYADFCEGFAAWNRRSLFAEGDGALAAQPDLLGSYGFTPLMPPHPTPVGSRSEAMVATLRIAERRGHAAEAERLRAQLRASFRFLLEHQLTDGSAWLMPNPAGARGGFLMSDVKRVIRIDFIQHACSAMMRGSRLLGLPSH